MDSEIKLTGGNSTASVVKVGNTVKRSMGEASPTVHRLLMTYGVSVDKKFLDMVSEVLHDLADEVLMCFPPLDDSLLTAT